MNEMISIIVPVYNAEKYIVDTMNSVIQQTYTDWELLLVLNGCTDNSESIVRDYQEKHSDKKIRVILEENNKGAAMARNRGVNEAAGNRIRRGGPAIWQKRKPVPICG